MTGRPEGDGPGGGFTERIVRLLVALYPRAFRDRFGRAMVDDFRELASSEGRVATLSRAARDAVTALPTAWLRTGRNVVSESALAPGTLAREIRLAARSLRRDPAFTAPAVVVLGLAIGVGAAALAVVDAYLLRPLPYPDADRLVRVEPSLPIPLAEAEALLEIPLTWELDAFTLVGDGRPEQVRGSWVTPRFFDAYGIDPALGRTFLPHEWGEGAPAVAVISHGLWQRRFGGDPEVLGRTVRTYSSDRPDDAEVFTIVGVLPADLWLHHEYTDLVVSMRDPNPVYEGRLRAGVSIERAEQLLTDLARARTDALEGDERVELTRLQDQYVARIRPTLTLLSTAVFLALAIACGNVALLFVVRAGRRERELALRRALGAGRGAVGVQLVTEGAVLAALAGVVGTALSVLGLEALGSTLPARLGLAVPGGLTALRPDATVLAGLVATCGVCGLLFGLLPLVQLRDRRLGRRLTGAPPGTASGRRRRTLQTVVVTAELALSLGLLVAAGLTVRSARHVARTDLGIDPTGVTMASVMLRERSYPEPAMRVDFERRLADAFAELPGVDRTGTAVRAPVGRGYSIRMVEAEPDPDAGPPDRHRADPQIAGPGYFRTLGVGVVRGRAFRPDDAPGSPPVAVVSRDLARALWPGEDPLGKRFREASGEDATWRTVVGVVEDVTQDPLGEPHGDYYLPMAQEAPRFVSIFLRTRAEEAVPVAALEEAVASLDPEVAVSGVRSVESMAREIEGPGHFLALLMGASGAFAVGLALLGLYGTVAYEVTQRRYDVAVRMALGARGRRVSGDFVRERLGVLTAGVILGWLAARLVARLVAGQLQGVSPADPATYVVSAALLAAAALAAIWLPARRAARTDPMRVLREE